MKFSYLFVVAFLFFGCSNQKLEPKVEIIVEQNIPIYDLVRLAQTPEVYTKDINFTASPLEIQERFERAYFRVWNIEKQSTFLEEVKWPFRSYTPKNSYGENLQPHTQSFFDLMYENSNFDDFSTLNKRAVTLYRLDLRLFPTNTPLLHDPSLAGEGFPFDYLQNSSVHANKPLFVSHYSKDKEWVYVFSSFASGWVKTNQIAFLDKIYTDLWQNAQQVFLTEDNIALHDEEGNFLFKSKIGMMLALIDEDDENYTLLAVSSYKISEPQFVKTKISKAFAHKEKLDFTSENLNKIVGQLALSHYGWGGMHEQRDCSSMMRDLFAPFGVWLPRNSYSQSRVGQVISFEGMSDEEKIQTIKEKGIPFKTLLYRKGHIVLYVGTVADEIVIFHDTWGIRTLKDGVEGRVVIGRAIFSSLYLGEEQKYFDTNATMLKSFKSMNILF
ncbi:MAG: SH3 domain-containing protein [Sulfurimonas sp.]|nr:SH3 domain-containing protein [Sulfurimonas sp.]